MVPAIQVEPSCHDHDARPDHDARLIAQPQAEPGHRENGRPTECGQVRDADEDHEEVSQEREEGIEQGVLLVFPCEGAVEHYREEVPLRLRRSDLRIMLARTHGLRLRLSFCGGHRRSGRCERITGFRFEDESSVSDQGDQARPLHFRGRRRRSRFRFRLDARELHRVHGGRDGGRCVEDLSLVRIGRTELQEVRDGLGRGCGADLLQLANAEPLDGLLDGQVVHLPQLAELGRDVVDSAQQIDDLVCQVSDVFGVRLFGHVPLAKEWCLGPSK